MACEPGAHGPLMGNDVLRHPRDRAAPPLDTHAVHRDLSLLPLRTPCLPSQEARERNFLLFYAKFFRSGGICLLGPVRFPRYHAADRTFRITEKRCQFPLRPKLVVLWRIGFGDR